MTVYVISTMTQNVSYNLYDTTKRDQPIFLKGILIRGGAGINSARSGFGEMQSDAEGRPIWTAEGFVTPISEADWEILKENKVFKKHMDAGYIKTTKSDIVGNHRAVQKESRGMQRDGFQPLNKDTIKQKVKVSTSFAPQESEFRL